jgi:hypothetical protein
MARIIVTGYMLRHPVAGNLLAFFQYVLGLHRLGHEVAYMEESGWPYSCYDPTTGHWQDHPHTGLRIVRSLMAAYGVDAPVCYVNRETGMVEGATWHEIKRMLAAADLLLNVGGVCWLPEFRLCSRRAIVDMDPLFTQVGGFGSKILDDHQYHFSYGANVGRPGCSIPTCGVDWIPVVPPVVLDLWEGARAREGAPFTTIANWSAYGGVTHEGEHYGQKDEEFMRLVDLPTRTAERLELALSGAGEEVRARFESAGWSVLDAGREVSTDVPTYQAYIKGSRGELSAAKNAYVKTNSGWFSDRSACYLAAGLPVIVQETGFSSDLPVGRGLLSFSTVREAAACLEKVAGDYGTHRLAAREIAERHFSHEVVLPRVLDAALNGRGFSAVVGRLEGAG